jgi:hypothetical protein
MRDRRNVALAPSPALWPPDDPEESVMGTSLHQTAIRMLIGGINEAAAVATPEDDQAVWHAGGQTMIRKFRHPDGSDYTTFPDVFVYRHGWDEARPSLNLPEDGPPVLIIEVLSKETYKNDLDVAEGKGYSYRQAGVREYLTLDPLYQYAPEGGLGWQLERGVYRPWRRDAAGRWMSREILLAFGLEGARAAMYLRDGHRLLGEGEVQRALREQDRQRQDLERALREQDQQRHDLESALQELDRQRRQELADHEQRLREAVAEQARLRRRLEELEGGA